MAVFVAAGPGSPSSVCSWDVVGGLRTRGAESPPVLPAGPEPLHFVFPTQDGRQAYAWYHAPWHPDRSEDAAALPPVIVMAHGGPTGHTTGELDPRKQFWTSSGFAILDINYRGSTGYGREYRDALLGQWGIVDTSDIVDAVEHAASRGWIDPQAAFIRGSSAGGYTVLRALTCFPEVFRGGACYYGIGNLATLASVTHKFEKYYTDRLLGEGFESGVASDTGSAWYQRSPINYMHKLQSPMIVFQGLDDRIVPPVVSHEIVAALAANDVYHEYREYEGEGHGFRRLENNVDALNRELDFYRRVLRDG